MAVVSPWHSILSDVHHNNTNCNTGNNIESENRRSGTGGVRRQRQFDQTCIKI